MDRSIETEAETTEEAIEAALTELGVSRDRAKIEILEEPNKGLLGLRKTKARVRATAIAGDDIAGEVVQDLLRHLGAEAEVTVYQEDDETWVALSGDSLAWLIGHHGYTLDALQVLAQSMISRRTQGPARVVVDIEGYRARRKKDTQGLAERTVGKVLARQEAISLRPMNAYERKIVHLIVANYEGATSISTGIDPNRFVIIMPAEKTP